MSHSLNARCPFSPMPMKATSISGQLSITPFRRRHSCTTRRSTITHSSTKQARGGVGRGGAVCLVGVAESGDEGEALGLVVGGELVDEALLEVLGERRAVRVVHACPKPQARAAAGELGAGGKELLRVGQIGGGGGRADVFVEVDAVNLGPVDAFAPHQRLQHLCAAHARSRRIQRHGGRRRGGELRGGRAARTELGGAGGEDDVGVALLLDGVDDVLRPVVRRHDAVDHLPRAAQPR